MDQYSINDVKAWKKQCIKANQTTVKDPQKLKNALKEEKEKIRNLKKIFELKKKLWRKQLHY